MFLPGRVDSQIAFVLYREPKFVATLILVWWFLALFLILRRHRLDGAVLAVAVRSPPIRLLALLLLYFACATLWAEVPANGLYELSLYLPLFMLVIVLITWMRADDRVRPVIELSLITSAAVATAIGGFQAWFEPSWLTPINPLDEVGHPSVMGYKNPMALAIAGQLFLLFGRIAASGRSSRKASGWRWVLILCALAELAYLATLESRTSLAAIAVATGVVLLVSAVWPPRAMPWRRLATSTAIAACLLALGVAAAPAARVKAASLLAFIGQPSAYLESDRGVYLRNTLNMVRHRPWGVGTGDWQSQYPVYRLHDRTRAFDEVYEVRRAHSDHVQILGENGWLGLAVWLTFLGAVLWRLGTSYRGSRRAADLFLFGQIVFWTVAMATDYVIDLPFHRLAFFLLVACAVGGTRASTMNAPSRDRERLNFPKWARNLSAVTTVGAALLTSAMAVSAMRLAHDNAVMTRYYLQALERRGAERSRLLLHAASHGETLLATAAHSKTRYKDWQVLADVFRRLGNRDASRRCAERALELHPYSPRTFRLLARLTTGDESRRWQEGYEHILNQATAGYQLPYPHL